MNSVQTVFVVDDNLTLLEAVREFLSVAELIVETFSSAKDFLAAYSATRPGCLLLDIHMPDMTGIELQERLIEMNISIPIIVVSGRSAVSDAVKSMKMGIFDFLEKPYSSEFLLKRVRDALELDHKQRSDHSKSSESRNRFEQLTDRELQILSHVISGKPSKVIADQMGLAVSTVGNHRANIMRKLQAETSADLTRIALLLDPSLAFQIKE